MLHAPGVSDWVYLRDCEDDVAGGDQEEGEGALPHGAAELLEHFLLPLIDLEAPAQLLKEPWRRLRPLTILSICSTLTSATTKMSRAWLR